MTRKLLLCISLVLLGCDGHMADPDLETQETDFERKLAEHNRLMDGIDLNDLVITGPTGEHFCARVPAK